MLYRNTAGFIDASMVVISSGAGLVAGTVQCFVQRKSDSKWLQADTTWNAVKPVGAAIPVMTHVSGGLWTLAHTPADADDTYEINCIDSPVTCYPDNYGMTIGVSINLVKAQTDKLLFDGANNVKSAPQTAVSLVAAYDAAKTAAQQSGLTDVSDAVLGKWVVNVAAKTLTLYRSDGVTVLKTFTLTEYAGLVPMYSARTPQ